MIRALFTTTIGLATLGAAGQDTLQVQVHGTVVDATTGIPLLETLVEWYDGDGHRQAVNRTNNEGNYAFIIRTTGALELRVAENGYRTFVQRMTVAPGETAHEFTIRLIPK
ncbi:MAG: carboxypeptidase regulatory-like domain-containing protein [Flavobacteriales bacterium]|jgi:hypothetical protein|nr:carboxypeptidase regulatory-like domain-containing protein [Flavobacteriales bacterium]